MSTQGDVSTELAGGERKKKKGADLQSRPPTNWAWIVFVRYQVTLGADWFRDEVEMHGCLRPMQVGLFFDEMGHIFLTTRVLF